MSWELFLQGATINLVGEIAWPGFESGPPYDFGNDTNILNHVLPKNGIIVHSLHYCYEL